MSTNFYWTPKYGEPGAPVHHIGKQFGAGRDPETGKGLLGFCFQAADGPDGPIDSWVRWRNVISTGGQVWGDNGAGLLDTEDFIAKVEAVTTANRRKQFDMVAAGTRRENLNDWLDADGFSFTWQEFS